MNLNETDRTFLTSFIREHSGIKLDSDKEYLLKNRLGPILRKLEFDSFRDLCTELKKGNELAKNEVVDAISTNETFFFRDLKPFKYFENEILPKIAKTSSRLRILSAACSSGQEAYSLGIIIKENEQKHLVSGFKIDGFDISEKIVKKAKEGIYSQFEVQRGLSIQNLIKYFDKLDDNYWEIKNEIKKNTNFGVENIFTKVEGEYDCIFCRNVLIYFDKEEKIKALKNLAENMKKGASIILGASETNNLLPEIFEQSSELRSVYLKK